MDSFMKNKDLENKLIELEKELKKKIYTEDMLEEEKEKFRSLISNIPGAIYRCEYNKEWSMIFISDAIDVISGYKASEFVDNGKPYSDIIHPDDTLFVEKSIFIAVEQGKTFTIEYRIIDTKNNVRWVYEKGRVVYGPNNKVLYLDGAIFDITSNKKNEQDRERLLIELKEALRDIKTLSGLLPICANCKNVRDDKGYWNQIETYIEQHSSAMFTHGICPICTEKLYGKEEWYRKKFNKE
jgi:PAS domain S-box-containing protein